MQVEVVQLPSDLVAADLRDRCVVVFDVLRATTSIIAALANGARSVRVFESLDGARDARANDCVLAGEKSCQRPEGFDLGNSPGDFSANVVRDKDVYLSTTNGTRALVAAQSAAVLFAAALVNGRATAAHLRTHNRDVTLVCSGTGGRFALEDMIGAGAVIDHLRLLDNIKLASEHAIDAWRAFLQARDADLLSALRDTEGGRNVIDAGLERDIEFAAQLDSIDMVGKVLLDPLRVVKVNA